ncbi:MAG: NUDIX hydrolase [Bacteroidota bacterium]
MADSIRPWTPLASKTLIDRWWMRLRVDRVRLPTGAVLEEYHVAEYPDWACVLPLTEHGDAVLVEQYRYGIDRTILELPAGAIDTGESPAEAASRELTEETGYASGQLDVLGKLAVEPGRHTNYGHVFVAHQCRRAGEPVLDETEDLRVLTVASGDLVALVEAGEIAHGVHAAAIFWAHARGII